MKNNYFYRYLFLIFFGINSSVLIAQATVSNSPQNLKHLASHDTETAFSVQDQNAIIKACLTFQELKNKLGTNNHAYNILNHGIVFKNPLSQSLNGQKISYVSKTQLRSLNSYFLFHTIDIKEDKAFVRYYFTYTDNGVQKRIPITIDFEKTKSEWQVVNHTI